MLAHVYILRGKPAVNAEALIDSTCCLSVWTPLSTASGSAPVSHLGEESERLNTEQH